MSAIPLDGLRVLDLTSIVVGPVCSLRLAQYGAEVIKVEAPGGDLMRTLGGPSPTGQHSGTYLHLNRQKKSIGIDLKASGAKKLIYRLVETCDAVVANMRPDALERLGLDAATLRRIQPTLVHCTITGFGPGGPYRGKPAYDSVVQGASGIGGLFELRDGTPRYSPFLLADHVVGEIAAGAILAALVRRMRTGEGATVEVPMHETLAAFVLQEHLGPATFDPPLGPPGDKRILNPDNRPMQTKDGWISLTANTDVQSRRLLHAIGRGDLINDPRFCTVADRFRNVDEWFAVRAAALRTRSTADWLDVFRREDIPAMPCHALTTLLGDPHLSAVQLVTNAVHPTEGEIREIRSTLLFDDAICGLGRPAAPLGYDTDALLSELGLSQTEIKGYHENGTIFGVQSTSETCDIT